MARRRNSRGDKKSNVSSSVRKGVAINGARPSKGLSQVNTNAAGIDIGANEHFVAVPSGRDEVNVRRFGTFTADLYALADWLQRCKITTVAVETEYKVCTQPSSNEKRRPSELSRLCFVVNCRVAYEQALSRRCWSQRLGCRTCGSDYGRCRSLQMLLCLRAYKALAIR